MGREADRGGHGLCEGARAGIARGRAAARAGGGPARARGDGARGAHAGCAGARAHARRAVSRCRGHGAPGYARRGRPRAPLPSGAADPGGPAIAAARGPRLAARPERARARDRVHADHARLAARRGGLRDVHAVRGFAARADLREPRNPRDRAGLRHVRRGRGRAAVAARPRSGSSARPPFRRAAHARGCARGSALLHPDDPFPAAATFRAGAEHAVPWRRRGRADGARGSAARARRAARGAARPRDVDGLLARAAPDRAHPRQRTAEHGGNARDASRGRARGPQPRRARLSGAPAHGRAAHGHGDEAPARIRRRDARRALAAADVGLGADWRAAQAPKP